MTPSTNLIDSQICFERIFEVLKNLTFTQIKCLYPFYKCLLLKDSIKSIRWTTIKDYPLNALPRRIGFDWLLFK